LRSSLAGQVSNLQPP